MNKLIKLFCLVCCIDLFSCSELDNAYELPNSTGYSQKQTDASQYQRSVSEVLQIARSVIPNSTTRMSEGELSLTTILSSDILGDSLLDSYKQMEVPDTLLYAVNISDADGFCLISGDTRMPEILCFNDSGHLDLDPEAIEGSNASLFFSAIPSYYMSLLTENHPPLDTVWTNPDKPINPFGPENPADPSVRFITRTTTTKVDSVPIMVQVAWDQYYPFNKNLPVIDGKNVPTGCVPIAVAQLMSYFKQPVWLTPTYDLDWDILINNSLPQFNWIAPRLLEDICEGLSCEYGAVSTRAYIEDVPSYLSSKGYAHPSEVTEYNTFQVVQSLKNGSPVLIRGSDNMTVIKYGWWIFSHTVKKVSVGHVWVIDGYVKTRQTVTYIDTYLNKVLSQVSTDSEYLRCNWGDTEKKYNGYYEAGVFDKYHKSYQTSGNTDEYYQYGLKCINNIKWE